MKLKTLSLSALTLAIFGTTASAQCCYDNFCPNWYIGGGPVYGAVFHEADSDLRSFHTSHGGSSFTTSEDANRNVGGKAFVGYQFTRCLGLQADYVYPGKLTYTRNFPAGSASRTFTSSIVDVVGVATYPLTSFFSIFGRLGPAWYYTTVTATDHASFDGGFSDSSTYHANGMLLTYGVGGQFNYCNWGLQLAYDAYKTSDSNTFTNAGYTPGYVSAALVYKFA